jgi:GNAT superfamily N-acetyltransferase
VTRIILSEADETPLPAVLSKGFEAFNGPFVGEHGYKPLRLMVFRDGEDAPAGGIHAHCYAAWLHVLMVFLPEDLRRGGLGTRLFDRIEAEAMARGCVGAYLDTLSWQARPFYEKRGYTLFGTLPDSPPGHSRYFMMKRFARETKEPPHV